MKIAFLPWIHTHVSALYGVAFCVCTNLAVKTIPLQETEILTSLASSGL